MKTSTKAENRPPEPNAPSKVKSSKRKRIDCDVAIELEPPSTKRIHPSSYPDPTTDESLSEQSRRVLSYAYERCQRFEDWKFNKARQNWLLRNVWSDQAVPDSYVSLVIEYMVGIKGGARDKLIEECNSKLITAPISQGFEPLDNTTDKAPSASLIDHQPSTSRALSILHALYKR